MTDSRIMSVPSLHVQKVLRWPDRSAQRKTGFPQKKRAEQSNGRGMSVRFSLKTEGKAVEIKPQS